jgi:hypothetical protein
MVVGGARPSSPPRAADAPRTPLATLVGPDGTLVAVATCLASMLTALVPLATSFAQIEHVIGPRWALAVLVLGLVAAVAAVLAGFGHSLINLFPPTSSAEQPPAETAPQVVAGAVVGKEPPMPNLNLVQDLQIVGALIGDTSPIVESVVGNLGTLVAGQPVTTHPIPVQMGKLGELDVTVTFKVSQAQDAPPITFMTLFSDVIADGGQIAAGQPVTFPTFSDKLGGVYLDFTIGLQRKPAASALPAAA